MGLFGIDKEMLKMKAPIICLLLIGISLLTALPFADLVDDTRTVDGGGSEWIFVRNIVDPGLGSEWIIDDRKIEDLRLGSEWIVDDREIEDLRLGSEWIDDRKMEDFALGSE